MCFFSWGALHYLVWDVLNTLPGAESIIYALYLMRQSSLEGGFEKQNSSTPQIKHWVLRQLKKNRQRKHKITNLSFKHMRIEKCITHWLAVIADPLQGYTTTEVGPCRRMSNILTYVRVVLPTKCIQKPWPCVPNNGIYNRQQTYT